MLLNPDQQVRLEKVNNHLMKNPEDVEALQQRGDLLRIGEDYEGALRDLTLANQLQQENPHTLKVLAATKRRLRKYQSALDDLEKANSILPEDSYILKVMGATQADVGDFESAVKSLNAADEIKPEDPFTLQHRARAKHKLNDLQGALDDFSLSLKIFPLSEVCLQERSLLKVDMDDLEGALSDINRAVDLSRDESVEFLKTRVIIKEAIGDKKGAMEDLKIIENREKASD